MKAVECDCHSADAYLGKAETGLPSQWFAQCLLGVTSAGLGFLAAGATIGAFNLGCQDSSIGAGYDAFLLGDGSSGASFGPPADVWTQFTSDPVLVGAFSADTWHTVVLHYNAGTVTWLLDGTPIFTYAETFSDPAAFEFGGEGANHIAGEVYYIADVRIGTTLGGTDIFADDFSSGSFSAGWTQVAGAVTIVDDPFTAPVVSALQGIRVAFPSAAYDTGPIWVRLDDPSYPNPAFPDNLKVVRSWTSDRGRQYEMDKTQAGTAVLTIVDEDGLLDPTNAASPFFGNITPLKQVKITVQNPCDGSYHDIFTGFTESWVWDTDPAEKYLTVTLNCTDGFEPLARAETVPDGTGTTTYDGGVEPDSRIGAALDDAGWPALWRNLFTGNVYMQDTIYNPQTSILAVIQDAADAEFPNVANVFMDRWGRVAFRGRWARFAPQFYEGRDVNSNPPDGSAQIIVWNVGDGNAARTFADTVPISGANQDDSGGTTGGLEWTLDLKNMVNTCLCSPYNIAQAAIAGQRVFDTSSIDAYGVRFLSIPDLLIEGSVPGPSGPPFPATQPGGDGVGMPAADPADEAKIIGQCFVDNYAQPIELITTLTFDSRDPDDPLGPATWKFLTGVEIGDIVIVTQTNPGGGGFKQTQFFVEGIHNSVGMSVSGSGGLGVGNVPQWTMTLDLSPRLWYSKFAGVVYYP